MDCSDQEWEVEKILQRGKFKNVTHYLILWKGFKPQEATWEPITNLQHCKQAILDFQSQLKNSSKLPQNKKEGKKKMNFRKVFKVQRAVQQSNPKKESCVQGNEQIELVSVTSSKDQQPSDKQKQMSQPIRPSSDFISRIEVKDQIENKEKQSKEKHIDLEKEAETKRRRILSIQNEQCKQLASKKIKQNENLLPKKIAQTVESNPYSPIHKLSQQQFIKNIIPVTEQKQKNTLNTSPTSQKNQQTSQYPKSQKQAAQSLITKANDDSKVFELLTLSQKQARYRYCDVQYEKRQKEALNNMIRKINGKPRSKSRISMIDISKNPQFLADLGFIEQTSSNFRFQKIDLFIKSDYAWIVVGRNAENKFAMNDVNYVRQDIWKALQKRLNEIGLSE